SASGSRILKLSPEPMPRPPDTTTRAEVSSGRSDLVSARPTSDDRPASAPAWRASTASEPPLAETASKPVVRTVMILILSFDCTVARALRSEERRVGKEGRYRWALCH